jgi:hypothetical protein
MCLITCLFTSGCRLQFLTLFSGSILDTCLANLMRFYLLTIVIRSEEYKLWSLPLFNCLHPPITLSLNNSKFQNFYFMPIMWVVFHSVSVLTPESLFSLYFTLNFPKWWSYVQNILFVCSTGRFKEFWNTLCFFITMPGTETLLMSSWYCFEYQASYFKLLYLFVASKYW